jgi:hypothetical protein
MLENKKFWEELIAYFLFTVILVSDMASGKKLLVYIQTNSVVSVCKANYTDRATAAWRPILADRVCRVVSATNPHGR